MDLTNKQVTVDSMSVTTFPPKTIANVVIHEEVIEGIFKVVGNYSLSFEQTFQNSGDAALMAAISDKLQEIPE